MTNIVERIDKIAEKQGIAITKLEAEIGASKGVLSRALKNGTDIQAKWLSAIVENYPQYNPDWLLTGKGSIFKKDVAIAAKNPGEGIPLIPLEAMAGFGSGENVVMELESEYFIVPTFKGADYLIPVKGSSMYPKYNSGDIVACKKLPLTDLFFQWNKVYVLDTAQGPLIKRVKKSTRDDHVLLVSENKEYDPIDLPVKSIYAVGIVMGVIRLE